MVDNYSKTMTPPCFLISPENCFDGDWGRDEGGVQTAVVAG